MVWSWNHLRATMLYLACSLARISPSAKIRSAWGNQVVDCLVNSISLGAVSNVMCISNHSELFLLS